MPKKATKSLENKKITGNEKKELEKLIKDEIAKVQKEREDCITTIKNLGDRIHLFPFYNCFLHQLEYYKERLEEINY